MRRVVRYIPAIACVVGWTAARGDICAPIPVSYLGTDVCGDSVVLPERADAPLQGMVGGGHEADRGLAAGSWDPSGLSVYPLVEQRLAGDGERVGQATIRSLPPLASSVHLALSAFATLGAYQLLRNSRKIHIGAVPQWYHSGGPAQVGQAVPFELDFSALAPCLFDQPVVSTEPTYYRGGHEQEPVRTPQSFLITAVPRGPPLLS